MPTSAVRLSPWKNPNCNKTGNEKRRPVITCNVDDYKDTIATIENCCEIVSVGVKCKVYLDWDKKVPLSDCYGAPNYIIRDEKRSVKQIIDEYLKKGALFNNQPYTILRRKPRVINKGDMVKHSYRIIFDKLITDNFTKIKEYMISVGYKMDEPFDLRPYAEGELNGQIINCVYSTKPDCDIPLLPYGGETVLSKMLITAVDEDVPVIDWNNWITDGVEKTITLNKFAKVDMIDDDETNDEMDSIMKDFVEHTTEKRADDYETWFNACCAFINIGNRFSMKRKAMNYFHEFSKKSKKYDEGDVDKQINAIEKMGRNKGYGIAYLRTCIKEDAPQLYQEKYECSYTAKKRIMEKDTFKVMNPVGFFRLNNDADIVGKTDYIQLLSRGELLTLYENVSYYGKNKKGEIEKKDFVKDWLKDSTIKTYKSIVFDPSNEVDKTQYYNIFRGFRASLLPDIPSDKMEEAAAGLSLIRKHMLDVYCGGNADHFEWLENWMASPIQQPKVRTGVAVIFHGKQGVGKNMVLDAYANAILGEQCSYSTGSPAETVFGRFNSGLMNKMLLVCNEAGSELYDVMDKLKDLLTSETINIEKKGKDIITFQNYLSIMMTTNNTNPLYISKDDRRLVWFGCAATFKGNVNYFTELKQALEKDYVIKAWYNHLKGLEMTCKTMVDFQEKRPITDDYKRLQDLNIPSWMLWLCSLYPNMDFIENNKREKRPFYCRKVRDLYKMYAEWCGEHKCEVIKAKSFRFNLTSQGLGGECYMRENVEWLALDQTEFEKWLKENKMTTMKDLPTAESLGFTIENGFIDHDDVDSDKE